MEVLTRHVNSQIVPLPAAAQLAPRDGKPTARTQPVVLTIRRQFDLCRLGPLTRLDQGVGLIPFVF